MQQLQLSLQMLLGLDSAEPVFVCQQVLLIKSGPALGQLQRLALAS
jgi:hypothetical protein